MTSSPSKNSLQPPSVNESGLKHSGSADLSSLAEEGNLNLEELRKDPKYRRYVHSVDKILQSFDTISEWADVIGFLTKLAKVLQAHPNPNPPLPRKHLIAKRLAQCLNPALPAGVHQKTIEVYFLIFEKERDAVVDDLGLWSLGIFPFLNDAGTNVKPQVLSLYRKHYLPLGLKLKPLLKPFIIAVLPLLEEETGEFFQDALALLSQVSTGVGQTYFYHCLWLAIITAPHHRLAGLNFLLKRMPNVKNAEDVAVVLGNDTRLLARAIGCCLEDERVLVCRGALEVLVGWFPIERKIFGEPDLRMLLGSAVGVVLRKDMSLMRRLSTWLLGSSGANSKVMPAETRKLVGEAIKHLLRQPSPNPYRILISLLDREELGIIVSDVMPSVLHAIKNTSSDEARKTGEMVIRAVEVSWVWKACYLEARGTDYDLLEFVTRNLDMKWEDEESRRIWIPILGWWLAGKGLELVRQGDKSQAERVFGVLEGIVGFLHGLKPTSPEVLDEVPEEEISTTIMSFLQNPGTDIALPTDVILRSFLRRCGGVVSEVRRQEWDGWNQVLQGVVGGVRGVWGVVGWTADTLNGGNADSRWAEGLQSLMEAAWKPSDPRISESLIWLILFLLQHPTRPIRKPAGFTMWVENVLHSVWERLEDNVENCTAIIWALWEVDAYSVLDVVSACVKKDLDTGRIGRTNAFWRGSEEQGKDPSLHFDRIIFLITQLDDKMLERFLTSVRGYIRLFDPFITILLRTVGELQPLTAVVRNMEIELVTIRKWDWEQIAWAWVIIGKLCGKDHRGRGWSVVGVRCEWRGIWQDVKPFAAEGTTYLEALVLLARRFMQLAPSAAEATHVHIAVSTFLRNVITSHSLTDKVRSLMLGTCIRRLAYNVFASEEADINVEPGLLSVIRQCSPKSYDASTESDLLVATLLEAFQRRRSTVLKEWLEFWVWSLSAIGRDMGRRGLEVVCEVLAQRDAGHKIKEDDILVLLWSIEKCLGWYVGGAPPATSAQNGSALPASAVTTVAGSVTSNIASVTSWASSTISSAMGGGQPIRPDAAKEDSLVVVSLVWDVVVDIWSGTTGQDGYWRERTRGRLRRLLEGTWKVRPGVVVEGAVISWVGGKNLMKVLESVPMIDPKNVVSRLLDAVTQRNVKSVADSSLLRFYEQYAQEVSTEVLKETAAGLVNLARDILNAPRGRSTMFGIGRIMFVYFSRLNGKIDDRRSEEVLQKIFESIITGVGKEDEKEDVAIVAWFRELVVPNIRNALTDQDKVMVVMGNLGYYAIGTWLRQGPKSGAKLSGEMLELLLAMTRVSGSQKAWRREVWDYFLDIKFFESGNVEREWGVILGALISSESERMTELINRVSTMSSSGLFTSRDQELTNRAYALRRLTLGVFVGAKNQFISVLPSIQEKLVEVFRHGHSVMVAEALFCLRALILRVDEARLNNFWPMVVVECVRILEQANDVKKVEAVCRCLDLIAVVGVEGWQWHQWMFITETVDTLLESSKPDTQSQQVPTLSLTARLAYTLSGVNDISEVDFESYLPATDSVVNTPIDMHPSTEPRLRVPLLPPTPISDLNQLLPFLKNIGKVSVEAVYEGLDVDWAKIDEMMWKEFWVGLRL
ncbi:Dopey, N-terminal-domain-containing protein [Gaertneriomyces semiglobifer]|nr:Dopey, N-terminal-domain-containing protein [Gaertneriomyces semiglobifer]